MRQSTYWTETPDAIPGLAPSCGAADTDTKYLAVRFSLVSDVKVGRVAAPVRC